MSPHEAAANIRHLKTDKEKELFMHIHSPKGQPMSSNEQAKATTKVKEIDVWVGNESLNSPYPSCVAHKPRDPWIKNYSMGKLIIYEPEKKIELTESMFDEAVKGIYPGDVSRGSKAMAELKQKLFGAGVNQ